MVANTLETIAKILETIAKILNRIDWDPKYFVLLNNEEHQEHAIVCVSLNKLPSISLN